MKTNIKDFLILLALPILFFSCSDDDDFVDPEIPGFHESLMGDIRYTYGGNEYSLKCADEKDLQYCYYHAEPGYVIIRPCNFEPVIAYSLRSCNKETEVFKDWTLPKDDENVKAEIKPLLHADPFYKEHLDYEARYTGEDYVFNRYNLMKFCIDGNAFNNCTKLKEVYLSCPFAIAGTSAQAFKGCYNLTDIYVCEPIDVESKKFAVDYKKVTLHVCPGKKKEFKKSYPWKNFKHIVEDYECDYHKNQTDLKNSPE